MTTVSTRVQQKESSMQFFVGGSASRVKAPTSGADGDVDMEPEGARGTAGARVGLAYAAGLLLLLGTVSHFGFGSPSATSALPAAIGLGILLSNMRQAVSPRLAIVLGLVYFGAGAIWGSGSAAAILALGAEALALSLVVTIAQRLLEVDHAPETGPTRSSSHPRVRTFDQRLRGEFQLEMLRSRRFGRPLSLLVIQPISGSSRSISRVSGEDGPLEFGRYARVSREFKRRLGLLVRHHVRRLDMVGWDREEGRYIVICPETPRSGTEILLSRIHSSISQQLGASVRSGVASSPDDGFELDHLIMQADLRSSEAFGLPPQSDEDAVMNP